MYTQCPECSTAFRVTAEVLKQAAGKVRCGGCGNAFNALEHLSEEKPPRRTVTPEPEPHLPELKPDPGEMAEDGAVIPARMSPEQSAALLKTLDELAGSDIRLEDTGIEWRLLDDSEADTPVEDSLDHDLDPPRPSLLDAELSADLESRRVDEVLSSSPTPVDEVLSATGGTAVDSPEVFDAAAIQTIPDEELRFDDNTGLPDDYDVEDSGEQRLVIPEPSQDAPEPMANLQVDLGFDDPGEWQDLLEEVEPDDAGAAAAKKEMTLAEELEAIDVSDVDDDETAPSGDELASQMEALSLELTGIQEELDDLAGEDAEPSIIDELAAIEIDAESPDGDDEAATEAEEAVAALSSDDEPLLDVNADDDSEAVAEVIESDALLSSGDEEADDGRPEFDADEIEFGALEESNVEAVEPDDADEESTAVGEAEDELDELDDAADDALGAIEAGRDQDEEEVIVLEGGADDEVAIVLEAEADDEDAIFLEAEADDEDAIVLEAETDDEDAIVLEAEADDEVAIVLEAEADDTDAAASNLELDLDDESIDLADAEAETSIDDDLFAAAFETEAGIARGEPAEPVIEPLSEEEQTINMMIDQDLLSVAVTDEEGFASTIVGTRESFDAAIAEAAAEEAALKAASLPPNATVETIIMSGEGAESLREAERAEALKEEAAAMIAAAKAEEAAKEKKPPDWRMVAGVVALGLLLAVQAIHFSRDALARVPVIHDILEPIYNTIGMPLAPTWEVTGWRVEKTKGSVDASGETLNIYTEVGNQADAAMPYPVIGVSLLDRFEESIGSRVFEPGEYLAGNVDRLAMVDEGQRFSAEMTIESPTVAASGFRLNVCYRMDGSRLRCAIEDFR